MRLKRVILASLQIFGGIVALPAAGQPLGTSFTYQGKLDSGGVPAGGLHDLRFQLFTLVTGGSQVGATICVDGVNVVDGLFTVSLDFGAAYDGNQRFLQVFVRADSTPGNCAGGTYTTLTPRQPLTATPYALKVPGIDGNSLNSADGLPADALFVDNDGRVGIGTLAPSHSVHIANSAPTLALQDTDSTTQQVGYVSYRDSSNIERGWIGYGSAGDPDLSIVNARAGGDIVLSPLGGGKVGVGTSAPAAKLHVVGGSRFDVNTFGDSLKINNVNGDLIWSFGVQALGSPPNPALGMYSPISGDVQAGMHRSIDGGLGEVYAERKNFRVPNPSDMSTDIWYCCLEGPEAAMYVRGTARLVRGLARVALPEHFRNLAVEDGMTAQVTPLFAESKGLAVTSKRLAEIEIRELAGGTGDYEFDWRVEAVRKGHENYQVIRPWMRSVTDESKAWENRVKWIAERRANGMP